MDPILQLLADVGIEISTSDWETVHQYTPPTSTSEYDDRRGEPTFPLLPHSIDDDLVPCFTRRQYDLVRPETVGYPMYRIVDVTRDDGAPIVPSRDDETALRLRQRPVHRYSRLYRLRRALAYAVGAIGDMPPGFDTIILPPKVLLSRRHVYNYVRKLLRKMYRGHIKASHYYASIPFILRHLAHKHWKISTGQWQSIINDATDLHYAFDRLVRSGTTPRRRFPKMQYVVLRLLDRHKIIPPYRVPWARTCIKRRQLSVLANVLDEAVTLNETCP